MAVLDEALFDLIQGGGEYYHPYKGCCRLDPLDLQNSNTLTQLIGIQRFQAKGASAGGADWLARLRAAVQDVRGGRVVRGLVEAVEGLRLSAELILEDENKVSHVAPQAGCPSKLGSV